MFRKLPTRKEKLLRCFEKNNNKINQSIYFQDIFVYAVDQNHTRGESKGQINPYAQPPSEETSEHAWALKRLIDQIKLLAQVTNTYHEKHYCTQHKDGTHTIKQHCLNKITRLLSSEFSFYTKNPLTLADFSHLTESIIAIAEKQQSNVHLLLSSFAVVTEDNKLLNMCLYVECGNQAKLHSFCKANPYRNDISYGKSLFIQSPSLVLRKEKENANFVSSLKNKNIISNNSFFMVETAGGARCTIAVDICLDYSNDHSWLLFWNQFNAYDTAIIPDAIEHIVTSNSVPLSIYRPCLTKSITQIDPRYSLRTHLKNDKINSSDFDKCKDNAYPDLSIHLSENGVLLESTPFGLSYQLVVIKKRKAGEFNPNLKNEINYRNNEIKKERLSFYLNQDSLNTLTKQLVPVSPKQG